MHSLPLFLLPFLSPINAVQAVVTVYGQIPFGHTATTVNPATFTTLAAYNDTVLQPPQPPALPPPNRFDLNLQSDTAAGIERLSIQQPGSFWGFSIEMSVATQVMGKNSSFLNPPFLNLLSNIIERGGTIRIRVGGNTQEFAKYVDEIPGEVNGHSLGKEKHDLQNPTLTPGVIYVTDFFYMLTNVSALLNQKVGWYLGIPFIENQPWRLHMMEYGENILGESLLGIQAANEPDLFASHNHRPQTYSPFDYFGEFSDLVANISANPNIPIKNNLIAPSVSSSVWSPEQLWETGFIDAYKDQLHALTVEHYPNNNCFAQFGLGTAKDPQAEFPTFLDHSYVQNLVSPYVNSASLAIQAGKPFYMFETNTASCGGFHGLSDSFGAALWALDYGLQMAYTNFSGALLHVGGQNVFYNPFTAPPTNQSTFNQWTIGAVYYSALIAAEVFGRSGTGQIVDLSLPSNPDGSDASTKFTPRYAIYENGRLSKVALFNYMTDPSGANNLVASIKPSGGVPASVSVKYFLADSVAQRENLTWAGQTFGTKFTVDGRLKNELNVTTIQCDQSAKACNIPLQAPGFALVFFDQPSLQETLEEPQTYATTARTKTHNTATVAPEVLATSNGHSGKDRAFLGSTSMGSVQQNSAPRLAVGNMVLMFFVSFVGGVWTIIMRG